MKKLPASYDWTDSLISTSHESSSQSSCPDSKVIEELSSEASSQSVKVSEVPLPASETLQVNELLAHAQDSLFRKQYIQRLSHMRIIRPQPQSRPHQTLVIFDWDDTLFPTSYLRSIGFVKHKSEDRIVEALSKLDKSVSRLLQKAVEAGVPYIVTNALKNWVEFCCERYMPATGNFIQANQITVVSARAEYENLYPGDPKRWKQEAFLGLKENFKNSVLANIICLGDSQVEIEAAQHICHAWNQAILKTIKFKRAPRLEELMKQHEVVIEKFDQIYMTLRSLTIKTERKN